MSVIATILIMIAIMVAISVTTVAAAFYREIRPAAMIDPDAPAVRTPAVAFTAGRLAALLHQPRPPSPIDRTVVAITVV